MGKNKKYSQQEKLQIILSILQNPKKRKELQDKYGISESTYFKWRNRFIQGGLECLKEHETGPKTKQKPTDKEKELEKKLKTAETRINWLATELEVLKKNEI